MPDFSVKDSNLHPVDNANLLDKEWTEVCQKLNDSRLQLTLEEEEIIKKIGIKIKDNFYFYTY